MSDEIYILRQSRCVLTNVEQNTIIDLLGGNRHRAPSVASGAGYVESLESYGCCDVTLDYDVDISALIQQLCETIDEQVLPCDVESLPNSRRRFFILVSE